MSLTMSVKAGPRPLEILPSNIPANSHCLSKKMVAKCLVKLQYVYEESVNHLASLAKLSSDVTASGWSFGYDSTARFCGRGGLGAVVDACSQPHDPGGYGEVRRVISSPTLLAQCCRKRQWSCDLYHVWQHLDLLHYGP